MRKGEPVRRADLPPRPASHPTSSRRRKGFWRIRRDQLGRGARYDCVAPEGHHRLARRLPVNPPVLLCRDDGDDPGLIHGSPVLSRDRGIQTRSDDLLDGRNGWHADDGRREHRRRSGRNSIERSRAAVGHEHADVEPAPLAIRPRGARARRPNHRHRPDQDTDRRAVRRVACHPTGHRRRAGPGNDARPVRPRADRQRLHRAPHRWRRGTSRTGPGVFTGPGGHDHWSRRRGHRATCRNVRKGERGIHSRELRTSASCWWRDGRSHDRLSSRTDRPLETRRRRRSALIERELSVQQGRARTARPFAAGSNNQHDPAGRSAHVAECRSRRSTSARVGCVQLESGGGRAGPRRGVEGTRARRSVHRRTRALSDRHR